MLMTVVTMPILDLPIALRGIAIILRRVDWKLRMRALRAGQSDSKASDCKA